MFNLITAEEVRERQTHSVEFALRQVNTMIETHLKTPTHLPQVSGFDIHVVLLSDFHVADFEYALRTAGYKFKLKPYTRHATIPGTYVLTLSWEFTDLQEGD